MKSASLERPRSFIHHSNGEESVKSVNGKSVKWSVKSVNDGNYRGTIIIVWSICNMMRGFYECIIKETPSHSFIMVLVNATIPCMYDSIALASCLDPLPLKKVMLLLLKLL